MGAWALRATGGRFHRGRLLAWSLVAVIFLGFGPGAAAADPVGHLSEFGSSDGLNAGSFPRGIVAGPDGNLWFADTGTTTAIGRIDPFTGHIDEFSLSAGSKPFAIALGSDGKLWFTDNGATKAIGRIDPSTGHVDEFGTSSGLQVGSSPRGIAAGADGNLWFTDAGTTPAIGRVNPSTGNIDEFGASAGLPAGSSPGGMIAPGADGNLWFAEQGATKAIGRISPSTQHIDEFPIAPGGTPSWIAPGPDGNLWFTEGAPFIGGRAAIGRITTSGTITEFGTSDGLNAGSKPLGIASGPDGNLWFGDHGSTVAIGRVTTGGQINEYSTGASTNPVWIWPGADGSMWFGDQGTPKAIGRIGTGAPSALLRAPNVSGSRRAGEVQTCQIAQWANWAGITPTPVGYQWFRAGIPIPGQSGQTFIPASADVGQQISCRETVSYLIPLFVTTSADSSPVTAQPPRLSALRVAPRRFSLTGRRLHGRCAARTRKNAAKPQCRRRLKLTIRYRLGAASTVVFTLKRVQAGRKVKGRCVRVTKKNRKHKTCKRLTPLKHTRFTRNGHAGNNKVTLKGKFGGRKLGRGTYELIATPQVNGHAGSSRTFTFRITA